MLFVAGIYGFCPLITIQTVVNGKASVDFINAYPHDVTLEVGKVSVTDSDRVWWDIYFKEQIENIIKSEEEEKKASQRGTTRSLYHLNIKALKELIRQKVKLTDQTQKKCPKVLTIRQLKGWLQDYNVLPKRS